MLVIAACGLVIYASGTSAMHRHGYKGRKFGRESDQRTSLIKSLAEALIAHQSIETTLPKAKELVSYTENLITKAKTGTLHNRRQVVSALHTVGAAHKLFDSIAPQLTKRSSGHLKIEKSIKRLGDNAQMARVSFVDELVIKEAPDKKHSKPSSKASTKPKKKLVNKIVSPKSKPVSKVVGTPKGRLDKSSSGIRQSVRHTRSGER